METVLVTQHVKQIFKLLMGGNYFVACRADNKKQLCTTAFGTCDYKTIYLLKLFSVGEAVPAGFVKLENNDLALNYCDDFCLQHNVRIDFN